MVMAFTNKVGSFVLENTVVDEKVTHAHRGGYGDNGYYELELERTPKQYLSAESKKPLPVNLKDHHGPHYYLGRFASEVEENTPISYTRKLWNSYGQYWELWEDYTQHIAPSFLSPLSVGFDHLWYDNTVDASVVEALNRIQGSTSAIGAACAEGRETGAMLGKQASQLARAIHAARKGFWGDVPRILECTPKTVLSGKTLSQRWLEYIYGWRPLVSDIHDTTAAVLDILQKPKRLKATANKSFHSDSKSTHNGLDITTRSSISARTTFRATVINPYAAAMSQFGLINPAAVAWEVVPFSFVLDWFIPVGNTLQALTAPAGLQPDGGWTSIKQERTLTAHLSHDFGDFRYEIHDRGSYKEAASAFDRIAYTGWPIPNVYANPTPWSSTHVVNAIALMRGL